jgi:membrane protease YdiL (CAAX protease family)
MTKTLMGPILGVIIAIAVNAGMDAAGLSDVSFASLLPLMLVFWAIQRLSRKSIGIAFGRLPHYGLAILHPVVIIGAIALVCLAAGAVDTGNIDWPKTRNDFLTAIAISIPLGLLTEEAFFRGWLFGALERAGMSELKILIWTGVAFSLWHVPAVTMNTEDAVPLAQVPVLLINAVVIGAIWGMLRLLSGSILVTSVCHAVWNAAVYVFFGFGTTIGALGVRQTALYGPESGFLGLGLNLVLAVALLQWWKRRQGRADPATTP